MLNVLAGDRAVFEAEVLKTIWLGSPAAADQMIAKLQNLPQPNLTIIKAPLPNGTSFPAPENE